MFMTDRLRELSDKELSLGKTSVFNYAHDGESNAEAIDYQFADIHNAYLVLHDNSTDDAVRTEALKRLIFLNWYYMAEPAILTGMTELDEETMFASYQLLNDVIKAGKLDDEFTWMLIFYSTWNLILEFSEPDMPELTAFAKHYRWTARQPPQKAQLGNVMENRGQMGKFWNAQQGVAI